jgi:hypothetical protein
MQIQDVEARLPDTTDAQKLAALQIGMEAV